MKKYIPSQVEPKWQKRWAEDNLYASHLGQGNKYYVLAEFAYPSGDIHMGHWFTFGGADIYARMRRMQGYNVFFPNGFDAFGLPAENAAIKRAIEPKEWTMSNIESMKRQFTSMGASFTFDHEVITCLPEYYKWNQWIFLKLLDKGIAYRGKSLTNWCPSCQTVLADEQVVGGECERCGTTVIQKEVDQWFLRITQYADRLLWKDTPSVDWPQSVIEGQNNWIGRSEGVVIGFGDLEVFTTRADTIFGATFIVISPEHHLLAKYVTDQQKEPVSSYVQTAASKTELERKENKEKSGVFTGSYIKNPFTKVDIPVWVADYVLMGYGTGAIMAVPAHDERDFEFAKKHDLKIKRVVKQKWEVRSGKLDNEVAGEITYEGEGILIDSGEYSGLNSSEAREKISDYIEKHNLGKRQVHYHLHDWSISRQRYWGTPIPIIHCPTCGLVPVPEEDLPIELPEVVDFTPKGKSPLATVEEWVNVKCPKCGGDAKRDTDTMDGFFDNSWYFYRYLDPNNDKEIFDTSLAQKWLPLEIYFGGAEHTLGHTLYSRFFTKFFFDIGLINFEEYAQKRVNHGIVLGPDGEKMSKSRGNVVNPDEEVKKYGADAIRLRVAFFMPYDGTGPWVAENVGGSYRFLQRVWALFDKVNNIDLTKNDHQMMHKTIKKVGEDITQIKFNTAVAAFMKWLNYLSKKNQVSKEEYKNFLLLLAPFAPHITEELWQKIGKKYSIHQQSWPKFDSNYLEQEQISIVVQVNGKVRDILMIEKDILDNKEVIEKMAAESAKIQKFLAGSSVKKSVYIPGRVINLVV